MTIMAKKNENIAEETVKKTTKKAKTEGEAVEKTEEEIAAFEQYEEEIKEFIKEVSDFIVKTNYLNMIYDSNYFAYRLLT